MGHIQISRLIPASKDVVFNFITDLSNLPDWLGPESFTGLQVELPEKVPHLQEQVEFKVLFRRFGIASQVSLRVDEFEPGRRFTYRQISGFFRSWSHTQLLAPHDRETTLLTEIVDFRLPYGILGALADDVFVRRDLTRVLRDRQLRIEDHIRPVQTESAR